jgi:parallel beta-helix repeat protein
VTQRGAAAGPFRLFAARSSRPAAVAVVATVLAILCSGAPARAAGTYYVDNQNPAASDANPGTQAMPYRTISAASAAHSGPGTTLLVSPGIYRETVTVPASGDSTSPFLYRAPGPGVVVDGSDDFSGAAKWALSSGTTYLAATVTWSPLQVFVDGTRLAPSMAGPSALPANSFQYVAGAGLYVNLGGGNPGVRQTAVGRRLYGFRITNQSWVEIDGFAVTRTEDKAVLFTGAVKCALRNNTVTFSRKYGVHVTGGASNLIEKNNVSDHQFHGIGMLGGTTNNTIQDNECFRNADPAVRVANGLYVSGASGNISRRNRYHDNQDSGEQITSLSDNNLEIQNLSWNNGDRGFDHLDAKNSVMIGCVAYGNTNDGFCFDGASTGSQLYDCIGVNNGLTTGRFDLWVSSPSAPGFDSDFNLLWNSTSQAPVKYIATSYTSVAAFSAVSWTDGRTLQADPRFVNAAAGDFHLQAGSPAIDDAHSGLAAWPATDAEGRNRLNDPLTPNTGVGPVLFADRGAFEYQVAAQVPTASLSVTPAAGTEPLVVTADGSASSDGDGTIATYRFDFGDGASAGPQPGPAALHTFAAGTWSVTLTVTDNDGNSNSTSRTVSVLPGNQTPNGFIDSPAASLTIAAGQSVSFAGSGSDPDNHLPLSYAWSFGGGAPAVTVEDPGTVIFSTPGTYTASFTVTDALGLADPTPATRVILVNPAPTGVPADEVHWTFIDQNSVTLDWRGFDTAVRYGLTSAYGSTATAVTPSPLPFSSPGPFREARITGLAENTVYHYSIGTGPDHTFRTPPARGTAGFTIFAQGDIGSGNDFSKVPVMQATIAADHPDFVLMIGDLTYGNSTSQASVDGHFNDVMTWSQDAAYMPVWGNHEWESAGDDLRNYRGRFDLPNSQTAPGSPGPGGEDWSWFDYGNVRFIAYPEPYSNSSWPDWRARAATLMDQAQADPQIRFIVTFGHRPGYSSGYHGDDGIRAHLDALGATHSKYVLNLNGHSHDYERSFPQSGVVHITAGTGGSDLEPVPGTCVWGGGCPAPAWSAFRAMHFASVRLRFTAGGILGEAICGPSDPESDITCTPGTILDRFVIGTLDQPPVVSAPATATADENGALTLNVSASDPDGNPIASLTASGLPAGATFTAGSGNTSGTLRWTPTFAQAGAHTVTFTAANAMSGSAATTITVRNVDRAPQVTAPATAGGLERTAITFTVTASDPDGDAIAALTASALPTGATFSANASRTSGTFSWTPNTGQRGIYAVSFTAANALSGSATTTISVTATGAPVVTAPATATVAGGSLLTVNVTAADPNHGKINSLTATGLPSGATFSAIPKNTAGTLTWTPTLAQAGVYTVTFTATNSLSGSAITRITVTRPDRPPVVTAPSTSSVQAGTTLNLGVSASDPDGNAIASLTASNLPPGAVFAAGSGNTSGTLTWSPGAADVGTRTVRFTATNALSDTANTILSVSPPNQAPVAALSVAPATGNAPVTVTADASGSTDPDGSVVSYRFDFGDGAFLGPQPGAIVTHAYAAGNWSLAVTVTDNQGVAAVGVVPVIVAWMPGQPNLVGNPSLETDTNNWSGYASATLSRVPGGFDGSWALQMTGPASTASFGCNDAPNWVAAVPAAGTRYRCAAWVRAAAASGTARLQVREYAGATKLGGVYSPGVVLSPGWQMVTVDYTTAAAGSTVDFQVLDYPLAPGEVFVTDNISIFDVTGMAAREAESAQGGAADPEVNVDLGGAIPLVATVAPSPMRSASTIRFVTSRPGPLRITLFDLTGRRVRSVLDQAEAPAGVHVSTVDGNDDHGRALGSGLYFYRIRALEGVSGGRIVIAR